MAQALVHEGVVGEFAIYDESTLIDDVVAQLESDLKTGELVALPLSLVVMVLVFAGVIAAGLPLAGAVASIGAALLMMLGLSHLVDTDATVINVVTVLGLGLSIDYGLLMVSRYREEVRDLRHPAETEVSDEQVTKAVTTTIRTAGRTVLFSGLTIAISLAGLVLFDPPILTAIGLAGLSVVVVAVTAATTLVPSLLVLAGRPVIHQGLPSRVPVVRRLTKRLGDLAPQTGAFTRLAGWTTRHRGMVIVGSLTVLGALALPASDLRLCSATEEMLPASHPTRQAATALYQDFPALRPPSIVALLRGADKDTVAAAHQWQQDSHRIAGVEPSLSPVTSAQGYTWFGVRTSNSADSPQATHAVRQLRESAPPTTQTWATGQPAALVDFVDALTARMWLVLGVVAAATLVLLFLLTGSVLIPVKAVLTNILSLGATLGVLVWAFQWGNLSGLLDFTTPTGLDAVIPTLILAFGFGLAMDYEVFLISRITECGLPGVRGRRHVDHQADRRRARRRGGDRRHPGPDTARPGHHGAAERCQLVGAQTAAVDPQAAGAAALELSQPPFSPAGLPGPPAAACGLASTPVSLRCCAVIGAGAPVSGSCPPPDLGKAIDSRIEDAPASSVTMRSHPKAIPPCGCAP